MWTLIKTVLSFCFFISLFYFLLSTNIGNKSVSNHLSDIWKSNIVQKKVIIFKKEINKKMSKTMSKITNQKDEYTEKDQKKLEKLLDPEH